jgi:hypothetical protein
VAVVVEGAPTLIQELVVVAEAVTEEATLMEETLPRRQEEPSTPEVEEEAAETVRVKSPHG